ncbi:phage holin family protein [Fertoebacter nigrum]|uniref:Phage holin family protein n=1 Tax=Fertoeibacter niger TaxID=2656921 RepID=A0A8X8GWS3_9RHOB|nr:phage holin family protein [Fertoeibacter niger]NUB45789.1 phage holin family protein [Fertoeibacter niger]
MTDRPQGQPSDLAEVLRLGTALVQDELALARAELAANLRGALIGAGLIVAATLLLLVGLILLADAAVLAVIVAGVPPLYAPLVVGLVTICLAGLLLWRGLAALNPARLVPSRAAAQLRRDAQILKEMISHDPQA